MHIQKFVLENGLRLIVAPMADCHDVGIWVFIKTGSQYENKLENGINHFIEHSVLWGTEKWPTHRLIAEELDKIALNHTAQTHLEHVSYSIHVPNRYFVSALDLYSDLICCPIFRPQDIESQKSRIYLEMKKCLDEPEEYVKDDLWQMVCFGDQPAGRPIYGTEKTLSNFTNAEIRKFFENNYVGNAIVISMAGMAEPELIFEKVRKSFEKISPGKLKNPFPVRENQKRPRVRFLQKDTEQTHFAVGFKTPFRFGDPEDFAIAALAEILHFNIYNALVGDAALSYKTKTDYCRDSSKSFLRTYAGVKHEKLPQGFWSVLGEYEKILKGEIDSQDLERAVRGIVIKKIRKELSENPHAIAEFYGEQEIFTGKIMSIREVIKKFQSLRLKDILEAAEKSIKPEFLNLAIVGPHEYRA